MSIPTNRLEFKQWCLRRLGAGAINIELTEEQIDDRVDYALRMFIDYHFEGTRKCYYKYSITPNNFATAVYSLAVTDGGTGYDNTDIITFSVPSTSSVYSGGSGISSTANATLQTDANGVITSVNLIHNGLGYGAPAIANVVQADGITPSSGTGAVFDVTMGGFIPIPDNIIGVVDLFPVGDQAGASNMFSLRYQIVLNDLYMFNNLNIVPYTIAKYNIAQIEEVLVGKQPIRYSRYQGRAYIDMDWSAINQGDFIVMTAYEVIDPNVYTKVFSDPLLQRYATAQLKQQWGSNLSKYPNMPLVGGMVLNGTKIYDDATNEIAQIEEKMKTDWWPIPIDNYG